MAATDSYRLAVKETELEGLDGPEMGTLAYPDFTIHSGSRSLAG